MKPPRGVAHHPSTEQMLRFRALPVGEKLRWLEEMRRFLQRWQPAEQRDLMRRFRAGKL